MSASVRHVGGRSRRSSVLIAVPHDAPRLQSEHQVVFWPGYPLIRNESHCSLCQVRDKDSSSWSSWRIQMASLSDGSRIFAHSECVWGSASGVWLDRCNYNPPSLKPIVNNVSFPLQGLAKHNARDITRMCVVCGYAPGRGTTASQCSHSSSVLNRLSRFEESSRLGQLCKAQTGVRKSVRLG